MTQAKLYLLETWHMVAWCFRLRQTKTSRSMFKKYTTMSLSEFLNINIGICLNNPVLVGQHSLKPLRQAWRQLWEQVTFYRLDLKTRRCHCDDKHFCKCWAASECAEMVLIDMYKLGYSLKYCKGLITIWSQKDSRRTGTVEDKTEEESRRMRRT